MLLSSLTKPLVAVTMTCTVVVKPLSVLGVSKTLFQTSLAVVSGSALRHVHRDGAAGGQGERADGGAGAGRVADQGRHRDVSSPVGRRDEADGGQRLPFTSATEPVTLQVPLVAL